MEFLLNNISSILLLIRDNFWQLIIIFTLLKHDYYWRYGLILLWFQMAIGYKWWFYSIILIVIFLFDTTCKVLSNKERSIYQKTIKDLEDKLKDPDFR